MHRGHVGQPIPEAVNRTKAPVTTIPILATSDATAQRRTARGEVTNRASASTGPGPGAGSPTEHAPVRTGAALTLTISWTRADGSAFDPWLRTHLRMGARLLGTHRASQTFTGTVRQWQEWSGLNLPGDGAYVIPDALAPLHVDLVADLGTCF